MSLNHPALQRADHRAAAVLAVVAVVAHHEVVPLRHGERPEVRFVGRHIELLLDVLERAVVVPKKALIIEKGGAYVFVVRRDSIVEKRFVETGPETGNNFIVERGLASYENIVVEGYHKLTHGMKVEPVAPREEEANPEEE